MNMKKLEKSRRVLPCADDDGNFMCFICNKYLPSAKKLYHHMSDECYLSWPKILPEEKDLKHCSKIIIQYTFVDPIPSYSHDDEDDSDVGRDAVDLTKVLPQWNVTKNKRGRPSVLLHSKNDDVDQTTKKCKVVEAVDTKIDVVLPEVVAEEAEMVAGDGGNVGFDFDLNK
ncbi:hypothetical protein QVD17_05985 [Tagetes erecta]|uniref:Uncharacterized protein n=1 Tax=Tagetes erecta TaxID=13708 RepID=A0AAD8P5Z6_TARER|nr:hypothetical protein QVD17_05985 [Tagetes erecta]